MNPVLTEYVSQSQLLAHLLEPDRDTLKGRFSHLALLNHGEKKKKEMLDSAAAKVPPTL